MNASELTIFLGRIGILRARGWWSPRRGLAATACLLLLAGCGGSESSGPSLDLSGTYRINGQSSRVGRFSATASVSQSGRSVTGATRPAGVARLG